MFIGIISKPDIKKIVYLRLTNSEEDNKCEKKTFQSNYYMQTGRRFM